MPEVEASLYIEVLVDCPQCDNNFDLMDFDLGYNTNGEVIKYACPNGLWREKHAKFQMNVTCPECGKEFLVKGIGW